MAIAFQPLQQLQHLWVAGVVVHDREVEFAAYRTALNRQHRTKKVANYAGERL